MKAPETPTGLPLETHLRRHLQFGWWSLLLFLSLGILLEVLHGFKVQSYLSVENESRRLMWRLAHVHGGALALIHLAFALTLSSPAWEAKWRNIISPCLMAASALLPLGFFLSGLFLVEGAPSFWIILVPLGGVLLLLGIGLIQWNRESASSLQGSTPPSHR